jgi:hypothetical protein
VAPRHRWQRLPLTGNDDVEFMLILPGGKRLAVTMRDNPNRHPKTGAAIPGALLRRILEAALATDARFWLWRGRGNQGGSLRMLHLDGCRVRVAIHGFRPGTPESEVPELLRRGLAALEEEVTYVQQF